MLFGLILGSAGALYSWITPKGAQWDKWGAGD